MNQLPGNTLLSLTYTVDPADDRILYLASGRVAIVVPLVVHEPAEGSGARRMAYRPGGRVRRKPKSPNLSPERVQELYGLMLAGATPEDLDVTTPVALYTLREIRAGRWPGITDEVKRRHGVWKRGVGRMEFRQG